MVLAASIIFPIISLILLISSSIGFTVLLSSLAVSVFFPSVVLPPFSLMNLASLSLALFNVLAMLLKQSFTSQIFWDLN
ncbi:hypothetical protein BBUWI9123_J0062 (plasmid) [Borreliella burgdorferi WI91-23]|nr:hypothetical protein BBUWI9123_J0062 [Borreliella burgdorferi WI91-23]